MREYKFRAWDSWWGRMYYFDFTKNIEAAPDDELKGLWILHEEGSVYAIQEKIKIMQFTGLHDKNGKEIYEGDIVTGLFNHTDIIGHIIYGSDATFFIKRKGLYGIGLNNAEDWLEVIGNIHNNPELLKEVSHEA